MVSAPHLCGDQCIKSVTCSNHGASSFDVYVRTGQAWRKALSTDTFGEAFLSLDRGDERLYRTRNSLVSTLVGLSHHDRRAPPSPPTSRPPSSPTSG
jgi:hypothetical protein